MNGFPLVRRVESQFGSGDAYALLYTKRRAGSAHESFFGNSMSAYPILGPPWGA